MVKSVVLGLFLLLGGCAYSTTGALITVAKTPVGAGATTEKVAQSSSKSSGEKVGESVCWNILGLVAIGDCTVEAAQKAGNITEIETIDQGNVGILGIVYRTKTIVKGK